MKRFARIIGTGMYAPDKVMTNADFIPLLGEDVDGDYIHYVLDNFENYAKLPKQANEKFFGKKKQRMALL